MDVPVCDKCGCVKMGLFEYKNQYICRRCLKEKLPPEREEQRDLTNMWKYNGIAY